MRTRIVLIAQRLDSRAIGLITVNRADSAEQVSPKKQNLNLRP